MVEIVKSRRRLSSAAKIILPKTAAFTICDFTHEISVCERAEKQVHAATRVKLNPQSATKKKQKSRGKNLCFFSIL